MKKINIPESDTISFKDFKEGNSIQVRTEVAKADEHDFDKGKTVKVIHEGAEMNGRIVSDPIVIKESYEEGKTILSLIVEKT